MERVGGFLRAIGLDRLAIALSGLCLVHCLATAVVIALAASAGGALFSPLVHEIGLAVAMPLGAVALARGYRTHRRRLPVAVGVIGLAIMAAALTMEHGAGEVGLTLVGVAILAAGHELNRRAGVGLHACPSPTSPLSRGNGDTPASRA